MARVWTILILPALLISGCAPYLAPTLEPFEFRSRAQTQSDGPVSVSAVLLTAEESQRVFAASLVRKGIQPVWLQITNKEDKEYVFNLLAVDPNYFSPSEAAWKTRRMGERAFDVKVQHFLEQGIPVVIQPKSESSGFVYANFDPGAMVFAVELISEATLRNFEFSFEVPGFQADYMRSNPENRYAASELRDLDLDGLRTYVESLPCCVFGGDRKTPGDPLNLVVVGGGDHMTATFVRRGWDLTETKRAGTIWRTIKSSLFRIRYRTSPLSPLYLFDRPQDIALQKARQTVDERNHLRLWRAPVNFKGIPVWVGQISRDIGVVFSSKTFVTHKIDPVVDEARFYLLLDLMTSQYVERAGFTKGVGYTSPKSPRYNYTKDSYFTDGLRLVIILSEQVVPYDEIHWQDWEHPPAEVK